MFVNWLIWRKKYYFNWIEIFIFQYLASKQLDIGSECFLFKSFGRCRRGVTCRFAESHIVRDELNRVRNKVNHDLIKKVKPIKVRELNHLGKDLQVNNFENSF